MKNTVEKIVCDAVLQNPKTITVSGKDYKVAPPTVATIVEASKYISQMPEIRMNEEGDVLTEVLSSACDCEDIGNIIAILMLGKKNLVLEKTYCFGLIKIKANNQRRLADELMESLSPEEMSSLLTELLKELQIGFFFGISTFLKGINLLRKTKSETIASGQL